MGGRRGAGALPVAVGVLVAQVIDVAFHDGVVYALFAGGQVWSCSI